MKNPVAKFAFRLNQNKIEGVKTAYTRKGRRSDRDRKELVDDLKGTKINGQDQEN